MIINDENICQLPANEQGIISTLYEDIERINAIVVNKPIFIEWQDWHNEYSPERTDPCPDYYGTYSIVVDSGDYLVTEVTLEELDVIMCCLYNYVCYLNEVELS